jgi:hypothetical protein
MWDGLAQQTVGAETPDEYVTQGCLAAAAYTVGQIYKGEPIDPDKQIRLMKQFMTGAASARMSYTQENPDVDGTW